VGHAPFFCEKKGARREQKAKLFDSDTSQRACADGAKEIGHIF